MATINDIWTAYDEGQHQWTGCAWPTHYGSLGMDLHGISSHQAHEAGERWSALAKDEVADDDITTEEEVDLVAMAEHLRLRRAVVYGGDGPACRPSVCGKSARLFCAEVLAREWAFAALWLEEIEADATWAEEEAREAVGAAERGEWDDAVCRAGHACQIQSGYKDCRPWTHLKEVIEEAVR